MVEPPPPPPPLFFNAATALNEKDHGFRRSETQVDILAWPNVSLRALGKSLYL